MRTPRLARHVLTRCLAYRLYLFLFWSSRVFHVNSYYRFLFIATDVFGCLQEILYWFCLQLF